MLTKKIKGNRSNTPRRKRMDKAGRLQLAEKWLKEYTGKNIVKGYAKWFGVSKLGAVSELKLLGIQIDEEYILELKKTEEELIKQRKKKKELKELEEREEMSYLLFGIPLENECEEMGKNQINKDMKDEDLPF